MATGKVTGEEERYSHTDLYDFAANYEGSKQAIAALRPALQERDPELLKAIDARFAALDETLDAHREGDGFVSYTDLGAADVKALTVALDAVSEQVAKVAGVVAQ
jgi:iron uptake system component EfeO